MLLYLISAQLVCITWLAGHEEQYRKVSLNFTEND